MKISKSYLQKLAEMLAGLVDLLEKEQDNLALTKDDRGAAASRKQPVCG